MANVSTVLSRENRFFFASFASSTTGSQPSVPALRRRRRESQGRKGEKEKRREEAEQLLDVIIFRNVMYGWCVKCRSKHAEEYSKVVG